MKASRQLLTRQNYVQGRSEDVPKKRRGVLRTFAYGYVTLKDASTAGRVLGRTQDVNLTIIFKLGFYEIFFFFSWFQLYIRHYPSKVQFYLKTLYRFCFGPFMLQDISTKIGTLGDVLRTLCAGWIRLATCF